MIDRGGGMKGVQYLKTIVMVLSICLSFLLVTGFSYLDPGTGSLLVQVVIAAVIAAAAALRKFRKNISGFFKRCKKEK